MSAVKEPGYFLGQAGGVTLMGPGDRKRHRGLTLNRASYLALFEGAGNDDRVGEASSNYLYDPLAAQAIFSQLPEARIVFILRHPVDRALSAYRHLRRDGDERSASLTAALAAEASRKAAGYDRLWRYLECGHYAEHLTPWMARFPRGQLHIATFEELVSDPDALGRDIGRFLGLEAPRRPFIPVHENASACGFPSTLREPLSGSWAGRLWRAWVPLRWRLRVRGRLPRRAPNDGVTPEERAALEAYFYPHLKALGQLLQDTGHKIPTWAEHDALQRAGRFVE